MADRFLSLLHLIDLLLSVELVHFDGRGDIEPIWHVLMTGEQFGVEAALDWV